MRSMCLLVLVGLLLPSFTGLVSASHPPEDQSFTTPHSGVDFPVGWEDFSYFTGSGSTATQREYRLLYPAMTSGEGAEMAGNGPFPHVQFLIDSGESLGSYMDFASRLVERGFMVAVHDDVLDSTDFTSILQHTVGVQRSMEQLNNTSSSTISGTFGQFDLNHWGVSGHGVGAAAAYGAYPYWMNSTLHGQVQPPRAVFGIGADFGEWDDEHWDELAPENWIHSPAPPSAGLFLTGSADEVFSSGDVESTLSNGDGLGWQLMEILGADHYQYQDSTSFLEGFNDGDASLTQDQQNSISAEHINDYLDVTLRGSHEHFRDAFNRPLGPHVVSDSDAYIVENLLESNFLLVNETRISPNGTTTFGPQVTVNFFADWTMRDGRNLSDLPTGWDLNIDCIVSGMEATEGQFDANGTAICLFPMQDVAPGFHTATIRIFVEGASTTLDFSFIRTDAPLVVISPAPLIEVEQRSSIHIDASAYAYDPDGQDVLVQSAEFTGDSIEDFTVTIDQDQKGIQIYHNVDGEEVDGTELTMVLRAGGGGVIDEANTTTLVRVVPVDDPVSKIADVPMQNMIEDGASVTVNLSQFVSDPEGEVLFGTVGGDTEGVYGPVSFSLADGFLTLSPLSDQNGATVMHLLVGDGTTVPVELDVPLYVEPVNDDIIVNESNWDLTVVEDGSLSVNLSDLAWDLDGDNLFWTINSSSQSVSVVRSTGQLIITPKLDYSGIDTLTTINVTDQSMTVVRVLNINVTSSPDAPVLILQELNLIDSTAGSLQWWVFDADGVIPEQNQIQVDGTTIENLTHSCVYDGNDLTNRCLTMLPLPATHNGSVEVRVSVYDVEIGANTVAYITVNMTPSINEPALVVDSNDSDSESLMFYVLGFSVVAFVILIILFVVLRDASSSSKTSATELASPESPVEETAPASVGLLARAKQQQ
jgi:hypothetical protein